MEASSSWGSNQQKRKRDQVVPCVGNEINGDDDPSRSYIDAESSADYKNKQPMGNDTDWQVQIKEAFSDDLIGSSHSMENGDPAGASKNSELDAMDYTYSDEYKEYDDDEDDYEGYEYDTDLIDCNYSLAAKFDDLDLPTGVEATVPWLLNSVSQESANEIKPRAVIEDEIDLKYKNFKQFDTVVDHSDHHYSYPKHVKGIPAVKKPSKDWTKRIQHELKVLKKDLPETIYIRVYEDRMDILRAAIIGPAGTPYHDGIFFFDMFFPSNYPLSPPLVHYHSGGLRLNPNLYACGKVCLSLLGTWTGSGCEKWNTSHSTMLQVLVSIQALILNEKPYFNEPGYSSSANTPHGEKRSLEYNKETFLLSCKTMLYSLRRPPKHFEDFVAGHFRKHGNTILKACKAYLAGAQVGCKVEAVKESDEVDSVHQTTFETGLKRLYEDLLMEFTVKGADCTEFLAQKVKAGAAARAAENALKL